MDRKLSLHSFRTRGVFTAQVPAIFKAPCLRLLTQHWTIVWQTGAGRDAFLKEFLRNWIRIMNSTQLFAASSNRYSHFSMQV